MIYVVKHKRYDTPKLNNYSDIYVGDLFKNKELDNINYLNPYINEATALYDIWKNYNDNIVGLVHYRRFFVKDNEYLSLEDAKTILNDYDIIITNNVKFERGIYDQLRLEMPNDKERLILDKYYNQLCKIEPKLKDYFNEKEFAPKEMFVCKKELIDKYCEWLFSFIIPITEKFVKEDGNIIQKRMIGHLVERLFYYYVKDLKIYRLDYKEV